MVRPAGDLEIRSLLDATATARTLADLGMLRRAADGFQCVKKIEGRSIRVYVITAAIFDGGTP